MKVLHWRYFSKKFLIICIKYKIFSHVYQYYALCSKLKKNLILHIQEIRDGLNANLFHIMEIWDLTSALDQIWNFLILVIKKSVVHTLLGGNSDGSGYYPKSEFHAER